MSDGATFEGPPLGSMGEVGALTLGDFLLEVAARFGEAEAVVLDDPLRNGETVRWTYRDLLEQSERVAAALVADGLEPGAVVAVLMGNRPEALAATFGIALAGGVAAPLSTFASPDELRSMLARSGAVALLTQERMRDRRFGDEVEAMRADLPALRWVAVLGTAAWADRLPPTPTRSDPARRAAPGDLGLIIFSSGTTSEAKGVLHAHRSPCLQFWQLAAVFGRHERTRMFSALPLFWTAGLSTAVGATLAGGGCWVAQEAFDATTALALMARERVTEPYTLPHQTTALAERPEWAATDLSAMTCVYGKSAYARHPSVHGDPGWIMPVGYGLTETSSFACAHPSSTPREQAKVGAGRLLPGTRMRVVDPATGEVLPPGQEGELAVAGLTLMLGYLGRPAEEAFDADGFFHTGDAGHVDPDGLVHFSGRRTEMIKTGGANVSPAEVEVALRACAEVKLSRIVGVPDPRLDEVVVACIVPADGASPTEGGIQDFLRGRIASYKVPKRVLFFADGEIPMTTSDTKVRDAELLALVQDRLTSTGAR
ncbi:MAG: class I adenylate-forming enzyme family protein [Acidimicrobiales bacterium]